MRNDTEHHAARCGQHDVATFVGQHPGTTAHGLLRTGIDIRYMQVEVRSRRCRLRSLDSDMGVGAIVGEQRRELGVDAPPRRQRRAADRRPEAGRRVEVRFGTVDEDGDPTYVHAHLAEPWMVSPGCCRIRCANRRPRCANRPPDVGHRLRCGCRRLRCGNRRLRCAEPPPVGVSLPSTAC